MNTDVLDTAPSPPRPFRWTPKAYMQAFEAGVFGPDARVELVDGQVIQMSPQYSPHSSALTLVQYALIDVVQNAVVRVQTPLDLGDLGWPEPDVAVVRGAIRDYVQAHPTTAALVVEVSDSTLRFDQTKKLALYATAGIAEYWIVNLPEGVVEVYRDPRGATYGAKQTYTPGQAFSPLVAPEATIAAADLLP